MFETPTLRLSPMSSAHLQGLTEMNADPAVMAHFPAMMSPKESAAHLDRIRAHWKAHGFGHLAMQLKADGAFLGFCGLTYPGYETAFTPCVEIGWRLHRAAWGKSLAFEAAQACLVWGFETLGLNEIVSFTARQNRRSIALMQRLNMHSDPDEDFQHPMLARSHRLSWHVLYRLDNPAGKRP